MLSMHFTRKSLQLSKLVFINRVTLLPAKANLSHFYTPNVFIPDGKVRSLFGYLKTFYARAFSEQKTFNEISGKMDSEISNNSNAVAVREGQESSDEEGGIFLSPLFEEKLRYEVKDDGGTKVLIRNPEKRKLSTKRTDNQEKKIKLPRPNYFLGVQVDNPQIAKTIQEMQEGIVKAKPLLKKAMIPLPTLHITLLVMHLATEDEVEKASAALETVVNEVNKELGDKPLLLDFYGLSTFNNQVLYVGIKNEDGVKRLEMISDILTKSMQTVTEINEEKGFQPHLTILKLSKAPVLRKKGLSKLKWPWYSEQAKIDVGSQEVKSIQLLSMMKPKDEKGYYYCAKDVKIKLSGSPLSKRTAFHEELIAKKEEVRRSIRTASLSKLEEINATLQCETLVRIDSPTGSITTVTENATQPSSACEETVSTVMAQPNVAELPEVGRTLQTPAATTVSPVPSVQVVQDEIGERQRLLHSTDHATENTSCVNCCYICAIC